MTRTLVAELGKGGRILTADYVALPTTQTVSWNPDEYEVTKIDAEKGIIEFKKIKDE